MFEHRVVRSVPPLPRFRVDPVYSDTSSLECEAQVRKETSGCLVCPPSSGDSNPTQGVWYRGPEGEEGGRDGRRRVDVDNRLRQGVVKEDGASPGSPESPQWVGPLNVEDPEGTPSGTVR